MTLKPKETTSARTIYPRWNMHSLHDRYHRAVSETDDRATASWILGGLALLQAIFLLTVPWFHVTGGPIFYRFFGTFSITHTAIQFPDGWAAVISAIAAGAVVLDVAVQRIRARAGDTSGSAIHAHAQAMLAIVAVAFTAVKFLEHINFTYFAWGFYVIAATSVALAIAACWTAAPSGSHRSSQSLPDPSARPATGTP